MPPRSSLPVEWIVYARSGCGLCEEFMVELAHLLAEKASQVQVVDIDNDPALIKKYFDRIPVLTIDGDFVCAYRLDAERVRRYLGE